MPLRGSHRQVGLGLVPSLCHLAIDRATSIRPCEVLPRPRCGGQSRSRPSPPASSANKGQDWVGVRLLQFLRKANSSARLAAGTAKGGPAMFPANCPDAGSPIERCHRTRT
eukprot:scaffold13172_cov44-Tisochrysis_lutea.AAC.3